MSTQQRLPRPAIRQDTPPTPDTLLKDILNRATLLRDIRLTLDTHPSRVILRNKPIPRLVHLVSQVRHLNERHVMTSC